MNVSDLGLSDADIDKVFAPYVKERFEAGDARWTKIRDAWQRDISKNKSGRRVKRVRQMLTGMLGARVVRTQADIEKEYAEEWGSVSLEQQLLHDVFLPCEWKGIPMLARSSGTKRVHELLLMRTIAALHPKSVLEVGCGNGLNLLLLSARFPNVNFSGIELTSTGVEAARRIRDLPQLPEVVVDYSPEPLLDTTAHTRLNIRQGSAASLPYPNDSFDLVFTSVALEQMEQVRPEALSEISRVARNHVVMIEPFQEWNAAGIRRDYIVSRDYFAGRISELPRYNLSKLFVFDDIPNKLHLGVGLVVTALA